MNNEEYNRSYLSGSYLATIACCPSIHGNSLAAGYRYVRGQKGSAAFALYAMDYKEAIKVAEHLFLSSGWDLETSKSVVCKFRFSLLEFELSTSMLGDKIPLKFPNEEDVARI